MGILQLYGLAIYQPSHLCHMPRPCGYVSEHQDSQDSIENDENDAIMIMTCWSRYKEVLLPDVQMRNQYIKH